MSWSSEGRQRVVLLLIALKHPLIVGVVEQKCSPNRYFRKARDLLARSAATRGGQSFTASLSCAASDALDC